MELLEQALAGSPRSPSIRYHLGVALNQAGDKDRAREMLEAALQRDNFTEAAEAREALAELER